jgi:pyruvate ferredoxin oxidoreductase gamma subunit
LLAVAAFYEGRFAQAFPSFGSERMGAPVMAFCRIDDREIRLREPVMNPDALIIQDPTLLQSVDLFSGLGRDGYIIINSARGFDDLGLGEFARGFRATRLATLPATEIAIKHVRRPVPNVPLLAGFAAISGEIRLDSVVAAIRAKFPPNVAEPNVAAAAEAYALATKAKEALHA